MNILKYVPIVGTACMLLFDHTATIVGFISVLFQVTDACWIHCFEGSD